MTGQDDRDRSRRAIGRLSDLQQTFEESRIGQIVISGLVVVIVFVGVAWNLPDSPIKRSLVPVLKPTTALNLNQGWGVYAPNPVTRLTTVQVQVTMADGSNRTWTHEPGARVDRLFASSRWERLMEYAVLDANARPGVARWAARQVTEPSDRPVRVAMIMRTQSLSPPGQEPSKSTATKVLYEEDVTAK